MSTVGKVIKCKGAVTWEMNQPPIIEDIEVDPPQKGEVRVKIMASGVCHSDLSANNGNIQVKYPVILGHEGSGIVESIGEGVTLVQPGDHIVTTFIPQCRQCYVCKNIPDRNMCKLCPIFTFSGRMADGTSRFRCKGKTINNFNSVSSFAEYAVMTQYVCCKVNKKAPFASTCLLACGVCTGYGAALNTAKVTPGSTCAVWGLGGIGLSTVMGCKKAGAARIFCIDINNAKEKEAKLFGMTDFINPKEQTKPIHEVLAELTDGGVHYAFDCVGHKAIIQDAISSTHPAYGTAVVVGVAPHHHRVELDPIELMFGRKLIGSWVGSWKNLDDVPKLVEEYLNKELMLDEFVSKILPLSGLNDAYKLMIDGKVIRTVLDIGGI